MRCPHKFRRSPRLSATGIALNRAPALALSRSAADAMGLVGRVIQIEGYAVQISLTKSIKSYLYAKQAEALGTR